MFFELAELNRYAAIAMSTQTRDVLRTYDERGHAVGAKAASKAMDASGIVPPDLPELEWGEVMGPIEVDAYDRIATTLELALAAGDLKPGGRGWRLDPAAADPPAADHGRAPTARRCWTGSAASGSTPGPTSGGMAVAGLASAALPDLLDRPGPAARRRRPHGPDAVAARTGRGPARRRARACR